VTLRWRLWGPHINLPLYPDAEPTLRASGRLVGLAGNQPEATERALRSLDLSVDFVASSDAWGVEKPSPGFFARVVDRVGLPPERIVYVGDRLDNDVLPAVAAGMVAVLIRRGPWGTLHARRPEAGQAAAVIDGLDVVGLPEELLART
jgi:HAD superfamily hydrolase (TIGR01509 family)